MNLKAVTYVEKLAQLKIFSIAAEELFVSQPALSQYIKKLEADKARMKMVTQTTIKTGAHIVSTCFGLQLSYIK